MTEIIKWCNDNQGFLSAVISVIAVIAAICIPAYIAHRQDKIALFEKRFLVLECLNNVLRFKLYPVKRTPQRVTFHPTARVYGR